MDNTPATYQEVNISMPLQQKSHLATSAIYPIPETSLYYTLTPFELDQTLITNSLSQKDLDFITAEIKSVALVEIEDNGPYFNNATDDIMRQDLEKIFKKINKIKDINNSDNLKKLKNYLSEISSLYLKNLYYPEFHSYNWIKDNIRKNNNELLDDLKKLINTNRSIIDFKNQIIKLLNQLDLLKQQGFSLSIAQLDQLHRVSLQAKIFLIKIDQTRDKYLKLYFGIEAEKQSYQSTLQTLNILHLYQIKKAEKGLQDLLQNLKELGLDFEGDDIDTPIPSSLSLASLKDKKIAIFTCSYGNGHNVTAKAIQETLSQAGAKASIYDLSTGPLLGKDRIRTVSKLFGIHYKDHIFNSVDLFNFILSNQLYLFINTKNKIDLGIRELLEIEGKDGVTSPVGILKDTWSKKQIREILLLEGADHILTTYHMDLNPIIEVAQELDIPLLHVPTDYNLKLKEVFGKKPPSYSHFKSLIPNATDETLATKTPLLDHQIVHDIGIPLRSEFHLSLLSDEKKHYRQLMGITQDEKVLYLSAGGNGQKLPHPEHLANSRTWNTPLHLLIIAGKNRDFVKELQEELTPVEGNPLLLKGSNPFVTVQIIKNPDSSKKDSAEEFFIPASELTKILDITDASIAKAGGISVAELMFKGVPILFDRRVTPFSWELFNIEVVSTHGLGRSLFELKDLEKELKLLLKLKKKKDSDFHFEHSREILTQTIENQISEVEADPDLSKKKGMLFKEIH